jgi:hypothetical protein
MTTASRKTINIVSQCESWLATARAEHSEIVKQIEQQEAALKDACKSNKQRISEIEDRLTSILKTIKAVIAQEGDASSLENKKLEVEAQLALARSDTEFAKKVSAMENILADLTKKADAASLVIEDRAKQLDIAKHLTASCELAESYGAKEAPEYETLAEAANDYAKNVRFDFGIAGAQVEKVVVWQVPEANKPIVADVAAKSGLKYLIKALPARLGWLGNFPGYSAIPKSTSTDFKSGDALFVSVNSNDEQDEPEDKPVEGVEAKNGRPSWLRVFSEPSSDSLYFPRESLARSGLCYVKETSKFYAVRPDNLMCAIKKTKREFKRVGYEHREVDVDYVEGAEFDASALIGDLFAHAYPLIEKASKEAGALQSAESDLAVKIREAICAVADTSTLFVERNQRLDAGEINSEVGAYWDAFVNAPWEFFVQGNCALLKHLCERKLETPHVYSYPVKGHYGMRVRTRDHGWIYANIFCPPDALSPKTPVGPDEVVYLTNQRGQCTSHVKIGPCCLYIYTDD